MGYNVPLIIFPGSLAFETIVINGQLCLSANAYSYPLSVVKPSLLSSWHKIKSGTLLLLSGTFIC